MDAGRVPFSVDIAPALRDRLLPALPARVRPATPLSASSLSVDTMSLGFPALVPTFGAAFCCDWDTPGCVGKGLFEIVVFCGAVEDEDMAVYVSIGCHELNDFSLAKDARGLVYVLAFEWHVE